MVLDENPLERFEALLDTKSHAVFVVREGYVVRNRLLPAPEPQALEKKKEWFAYSAPPFVLPTAYRNKRRWNRYDGKYATANFIAGLLLDRMAWISQDGESEGQVGDLSSYDGGEIRALRFGVVGTLRFEHPWIYTFFVATHAFDQGFDSSGDDKLAIFDLRLDVPLYKDTSLAIGKQKEPISMERLMALVDLPMQERSAVSDAMMPSRNIGIVLSGTGFGRRCSWAGGVFNPWLDQSGSISENATQIVGRGTVVALANADESSLVHFGAGMRYSNLRKGAQYRSTPEFNDAPPFVDSGLVVADDSILYDLEAAWRWGPLWLNGEYVVNRVDAADSLVFSGFHATASYILSGEMRPYNKRNGLFRPVPVAKPVTRGGWGAWEAMARFSTIDLQEGAVDGGDMDIYSLGLNWKLTSVTSLSVNYRHVALDQAGETGHSDGVMMRVSLMLE
jgi:phosphate-selective porin OprO/OprP